MKARFLRFPSRSSARRRADLEDELHFYFDMRARELMEQGMSESDARREAVREFGDVEYTKRYCLAEDAMSTREDRRVDVLSELRQDVAHTWRLVKRAPGFAIVAVVTLALGIGANTAIFSLVNGLLLRDLPYGDADQVVRIWGSRTDRSRDRGQLSPADFLDLRARQRTFVHISVSARPRKYCASISRFHQGKTSAPARGSSITARTHESSRGPSGVATRPSCSNT